MAQLKGTFLPNCTFFQAEKDDPISLSWSDCIYWYIDILKLPGDFRAWLKKAWKRHDAQARSSGPTGLSQHWQKSIDSSRWIQPFRTLHNLRSWWLNVSKEDSYLRVSFHYFHFFWPSSKRHIITISAKAHTDAIAQTTKLRIVPLIKLIYATLKVASETLGLDGCMFCWCIFAKQLASHGRVHQLSRWWPFGASQVAWKMTDRR